MEQAIGKVTKISGKKAKVMLDRKTMCGESCASCGNLCGITNTEITARNGIGASLGDIVTVEIPTRKGILAMLITYGVPLLYTIIITVLMALFLEEKAGAILLLLGVISWFVVLWLLEKRGIFFSAFKTDIIKINTKDV